MEDFKKIFESRYTWIEGFMRNVRRYGNRPAMISPADGRSWTYRELDRECNRFANALTDAGLAKGDVLMMQLGNCPEFAIGYVAAHKTGAICCPVSFRFSPGELAWSIDDSRPKVLMFLAELRAFVMGMVQIVVPIVPTEDLLPGIGENIFERSRHRVHDHFLQGLVGMGGNGGLIGLRHFRGSLAGYVCGNTRRVDSLSGLASDRQDVGNLPPGLRGDDLVHERGSLADSDNLQIARAAAGIEQPDKDIEIRVGVVLVSRGIDDHGGPIIGIQQRLDVHFPQQRFCGGPVQLPVRIDEEDGREIVGTAFRTRRTAILDGPSRTGGHHDILRHRPRLGGHPQAHRQGANGQG